VTEAGPEELLLKVAAISVGAVMRMRRSGRFPSLWPRMAGGVNSSKQLMILAQSGTARLRSG